MTETAAAYTLNSHSYEDESIPSGLSEKDHCPSCGVAYIHHLGLIGTCANHRQLQSRLNAFHGLANTTITCLFENGKKIIQIKLMDDEAADSQSMTTMTELHLALVNERHRQEAKNHA